MTKKDIVMKISNEINLTQIDVKKIVQRTLDTILEALERGETVELRNFGVFKVKNRRGRIGRNPRTGRTTASSISRKVRCRATSVGSIISRAKARAPTGAKRPPSTSARSSPTGTPTPWNGHREGSGTSSTTRSCWTPPTSCRPRRCDGSCRPKPRETATARAI